MKIFIIVIITAIFCESCTAQEIKKFSIIEDSVHMFIQGKWRSVQDKNSQMEASESFIKEYYKGIDGIDTFRYSILRFPCDSVLSSTIGTGYYLKKIGMNGSEFCYSITFISSEFLELVYSGGRVLSFKKIRKP